MRKIELSTNEKLLEKLIKAVEKGISDKDIESQRISIIYSGLPKNSVLTKEQIKRAVG